MSKTYQLTNTGDLQGVGGMEINEISYAGKSDFSTVYIDTGITGVNALYYKIKFKYKNYVSGSYQGLGGIGQSATARNSILFNSSNKLYLSLGGTNITSTMTFSDATIYYLENTITGSNYSINIYDGDNNLLENNDGTFTGTLGTSNFHIFRRYGDGISSYWWDSEIYSFTINNETWYINQGVGSTITGSNSTELTVNGTLTDFWQVSEIWNYPSNFIMGNNGTVRCEEFIEDDTLDVNMRINTNNVTVKNEFLEI